MEIRLWQKFLKAIGNQERMHIIITSAQHIETVLEQLDKKTINGIQTEIQQVKFSPFNDAKILHKGKSKYFSKNCYN